MASRYPSSWIDELVSRTDIVQLVSSYTPLKRNGRKYWGLCPFHGEKTASFSVDAEQQMFYCFGCKAGGGPIRFVMDIERLSFRDAVKQLADRAHLPLPEMQDDPDYERKRTQRERLLNANREAARFYHSMLFTEDGKNALAYLKGRGLSDNVIRKFGLGAAPDQWDALTQHLKQLGYTEEELRLAGLAVVKEAEPPTEQSGGKPRRVFDMFRNRAMFPIIDQYGNVLAFGGRILGKGEPKYLNTSDTPVFNKRLGVYAANLLRKERHLDRVILVEGYMDVVSLVQFGVTGVCATLGTALTAEQAKLLRRFAPQVWLSYDGDSAGQHAILRGLDILKAEGIPAKVLDFPDGLDPDEYIRRDGAEGFATLQPITAETYRIRRMKEQFNLTTQEGRTEYAKACAAIICKLEPVELENHLQELMVQSGFTREVLLAQIRATLPKELQKEQQAAEKAVQQASAPARSRPQTDPAVQDKATHAQELLISLLATGRLPGSIAEPEDFSDELLQELCRKLKEGRHPATLMDEQQDEALHARVSRLLMAPPGDSTDELIRMAQDCLTVIRRERIENQITNIMKGINTLSGADKASAISEVARLTAQLKQLKQS